MKKVLVIMVVLSLISGAVVAQDQMGLVLTTPGLHALAPRAFEGGIGVLLPMGNFDLRPAVGFNTASQSNGVEQSMSAFNVGVDLLQP